MFTVVFDSVCPYGPACSLNTVPTELSLLRNSDGDGSK